MVRAISFIQQYQITSFLLITFVLSLFSFCIMFFNSKWQTPENLQALPIWVIAVWSPSISALIIWFAKKELSTKFLSLFSLPTFSPWLMVLFVPIIILLALLYFHTPGSIDFSKVSLKVFILLILLNLVLGPLGEEAGWRGFMLPILQSKFGWMGATLLIALIWSFWHAPLWLIKSPQSEINFWIFVGHVFCYSILMSILYNESGGSLIPVIIFHLLVNFISGYSGLLGTHTTPDFYRLSLYYYIIGTLVSVVIYELIRDKTDCC